MIFEYLLSVHRNLQSPKAQFSVRQKDYRDYLYYEIFFNVNYLRQQCHRQKSAKIHMIWQWKYNGHGWVRNHSGLQQLPNRTFDPDSQHRLTVILEKKMFEETKLYFWKIPYRVKKPEF